MRFLIYTHFILLNLQTILCTTNDSCLSVKLYDSFGDGWGNVAWYYEAPNGVDHYAAPTCSSNPSIQSICGNTEGFYYLTSIASTDEEPENTWEIRWTVEIGKTGELYTGGYNTTMVFDFDSSTSAWSIVYWQNLWSNTLNFTSCGASESVYEGSCKPKPSQPDLDKPSIDINKKLDDLETDDTSLILKRTPTSAPISSKLIGSIGKHVSGSNKRSLDSSSKGSLLIRKSPSDSNLKNKNGLLSSKSSNEREKESYEDASSYNMTVEEEYEEGEGPSNPSLHNAIMKTVKSKRKSGLIDLGSINGDNNNEEESEYNETSYDMDNWQTFSNYTDMEEEDEERGSEKEKLIRNSNANGLLKGATNKRWVAKKGSNDMINVLNVSSSDSESTANERKSIFKNKKVIKLGGGTSGGIGPGVDGFDIYESEDTSTSNVTSTDSSWSPVVEEEDAVSDKTMVYQHVTDSSSTSEVEEEEESTDGASVSSTSSSKSSRSKGESSSTSSSNRGSTSSNSKQKTISLTTGDLIDGSYSQEESDLSFTSPSSSKYSKSNNSSESSGSGLKDGGNSGGLLKGNTANKRGSTKSGIGSKDNSEESSAPSTITNSTSDNDNDNEEIKDEYQITTPEVVQRLGRNRHKHPRVKKGYPSTLLKVTMFDSQGDGWYQSNYEGSAFYISDETKTELLAYGTLENGTYSGFCSFCFDDGSYYFRATTDATNTGAKWSFCHTQGTIGEQLSFHIKDGRCIPDALVDVDMICDGTYSTVVTVKGKLAIAGVATEMFDSQSASVVTHALSESVFGWDNSEILISETTLNMRALSSSQDRVLTSFVYDIDFEASFVSEMAYEVDGTSYYGVVGLVVELSEELENVLLSGQFVDTVKTLAMSLGVTSLDDVTSASLLSLEVEDISYVGTKELVLSGDYEETGTETSSSYLEDTLSSYQVYSFVAVVVLGFISFVGVLSVTVQMNRNPSRGVHVLLPELDSSVSNHLTFTRPNRQNIQSAL